MRDRQEIEREITDGLEWMQRDLGIAPTSSLPYVGRTLMFGSLGAALLIALTQSSASQQLGPGDLAPGPIWCQGSEKHIANSVKTKRFRKPRAVSGDEARYWSGEVFGFSPPVDHAIILPMPDGGTILVPCIWGQKGPEFAGEQANRVTIDMTFRRSLSSPMTDQPDEQVEKEQPKPKKKTRTRKGEP